MAISAFPTFIFLNYLHSNVISTLDSKGATLVPYPDQIVFRKIVANGNSKYVDSFKREEKGPHKLWLSPFCILIKERGNNREVVERFLGRDYLMGGRSWEPSIFPNTDPLAVSHPPLGAFSNDLQAVVYAPPHIARIVPFFGI